MSRYFAASMQRFHVADLRNSGLLRVICPLNRDILIDSLFAPGLFRGSFSLVLPVELVE
jgi:hypothetical protein